MKKLNWIFIVLTLSGCGSQELDRQTALKLLQEQEAETVSAFFVSRHFPNEGKGPAFETLAQAGVVNCAPSSDAMARSFNASECSPGSNGGLSFTQHGQLSFVAGQIVPTEVTGVSKTGENSSVADVVFSFRPSPIYEQHRNAFDQLKPKHQGALGMSVPLSQRTVGRNVRAVFQRYDDGWRLERLE